MVAGDGPDHPFATWRSPSGSGHHRLGAGFIEKDQRRRIDGRHLRSPLGTGHLVSLGGNQRLFLSGRPSQANWRLIVAGLTLGCPARAQVAHCSARVASGWART